MTPEDRPLDTDFFLTNQPLTLYRLARAKYANLSGVGAALYPGRWNVLGQEAIYTSTEKSAAVLEMFAHLPKDLIPSNLALMKIRVRGQWDLVKWGGHVNALVDRHTSGCFWLCRTRAIARNRGSAFSGVGNDPFAVAAPSVIVPTWNVVLFPQGVGFWDHVTLESVEPFEFDPRLFPENTPAETPEQENLAE